jgi:RimJ/RimL family protein N-acetyltransferase
MSLRDEEKWFEEMQTLLPEERPFALEIRSDDEWILVGSCGLFNFNVQARNAELGIMIGRKELWDQGYGTESVRLLLAHSFLTLNLNRVYLRVFEGNDRARRVYHNVGFIDEGRLRQDQYRDGSYEATIMMGILRNEWDEND